MENIVKKTLLMGATALTIGAGLTAVSSTANARMRHHGFHPHVIYAPVLASASAPANSIYIAPPLRHPYAVTSGYAYQGSYALCYPEPNSPAYRGCRYLGRYPGQVPVASDAPLAPALPYGPALYQPYGFGYQPYTNYGVYSY